MITFLGDEFLDLLNSLNGAFTNLLRHTLNVAPSSMADNNDTLLSTLSMEMRADYLRELMMVGNASVGK